MPLYYRRESEPNEDDLVSLDVPNCSQSPVLISRGSLRLLAVQGIDEPAGRRTEYVQGIRCEVSNKLVTYEIPQISEHMNKRGCVYCASPCNFKTGDNPGLIKYTAEPGK